MNPAIAAKRAKVAKHTCNPRVPKAKFGNEPICSEEKCDLPADPGMIAQKTCETFPPSPLIPALSRLSRATSRHRQMSAYACTHFTPHLQTPHRLSDYLAALSLGSTGPAKKRNGIVNPLLVIRDALAIVIYSARH